MTLGAAVGGPVGAIVGGTVGGLNVVAQFINPNLYDDIKGGAYKAYDDASETVKNIGKGISQGVNTVKNVFKNVVSNGKSIRGTMSMIKLPYLK